MTPSSDTLAEAGLSTSTAARYEQRVGAGVEQRAGYVGKASATSGLVTPLPTLL